MAPEQSRRTRPSRQRRRLGVDASICRRAIVSAFVRIGLTPSEQADRSLLRRATISIAQPLPRTEGRDCLCPQAAASSRPERCRIVTPFASRAGAGEVAITLTIVDDCRSVPAGRSARRHVAHWRIAGRRLAFCSRFEIAKLDACARTDHCEARGERVTRMMPCPGRKS